MNGIGLLGQNNSSAEIAVKIIDADPKSMGSVHAWGNPGGPPPMERDEDKWSHTH